jgi:hypothetical protein
MAAPGHRGGFEKRPTRPQEILSNKQKGERNKQQRREERRAAKVSKGKKQATSKKGGSKQAVEEGLMGRKRETPPATRWSGEETGKELLKLPLTTIVVVA